MDNLLRVKELLLKHMPTADVSVQDLTGTQDHLQIHVAAEEFSGLTLIKQHQKIMDILSHELKSHIHAVKIKTTVK
jgi:stress-induced morphogen